LLAGYQFLRASYSDPAVADGLFGQHAADVRAGLPMLADALRLWRRAAPTDGRPRPDLPALGRRDWSSLRDGLDALVGHLAGNVAASVANDDAGGFFLYGARQPARAESESASISAPAHVSASESAPTSASTARPRHLIPPPRR
jgi:hypothetical protein